ncbi:hypothetical protein B7463_g1004, partial [Scytalidium lignicola]
MSYYEDDEELDIRVRRGHSPVIYPEHRHPRVTRPIYYQHGSSNYLVPEVGVGAALRRSRSHGRERRESSPAPPPQPVIINNRIYNEYEPEEYEDDRYVLSPPPMPARGRSSSRPRPLSYAAPTHSHSHSPPMDPRELYELEQARKELEAFKLEAEREKEEKRIKARKELESYKAQAEKEKEEARIKKELELQRLRDEKKAKEEKERLEKEAKDAVEKYKREEEKRIAKEKKEKDEREAEYQRRLEEDLRKSGLDERQIAVVTKKEKDIDPERPTYTRMSRKYLSIETLNAYKIDYEFDMDPDYVLIKRWVPEYEQDFLWNHTREIRERRQQPVVLAIESSKKEHYHRHHSEPEFEFVRKKKHERKPSPSPLLTFLAGGKPR